MLQEIERKFKVKSNTYKALSTKAIRITQGYLSSVPERTVRVRIKGDEAFLTIKGSSNESGTTRFEWEKAEQLLALCEKGVIDKTRYLVPCGELCFEVDEFYGDNEGLVIAEIELPSENTPFERPEWLGEEVTNEARYYNAMLSKNPYRNWQTEIIEN